MGELAYISISRLDKVRQIFCRKFSVASFLSRCRVISKPLMNYATARQFLSKQVQASDPDSLLSRLGIGLPPVPGQVTSVLLALKVVYEALHHETQLDRELVALLHVLAWESRDRFTLHQRQGIDWPPLLETDLGRIAAAVQGIFANVWPDIHHI